MENFVKVSLRIIQIYVNILGNVEYLGSGQNVNLFKMFMKQSLGTG